MPSLQRMSLVLLLAAVSSTTPGFAQSLVKAERPEVKVGDSSVFQDTNVRTGEKRDTTQRLVAIDGDKLVTATSGATSGTRTYTREWNVVEVKTGQALAQTFKPFFPQLQFPLEIGRTWDLPFELEFYGKIKRISNWQVKARVAAVEAVTVAAGTFQTFRIEYDDTFTTREGNASWTGTQKDTAWYAPQAMRIVKRDFEQAVPSRKFLDHHLIEMMSFKPAP